MRAAGRGPRARRRAADQPALGSRTGFPDISVEAIESGIERFAGTLPAQNRIYNLLNANPLHIDPNRNVSD